MALPAEVEAAFQLSPGLRNRLDEGALKILARADPERAVQVLNDLAAKTDVRNPSAFVAATLAKNAPRHSQAVPPASLSQARTIQEVIQRFPELDKVLDESARRRLAEVDFGRATELIEELAGRSDVRNPSAFVVHALGRSQATQPNANALPAVQAVQARLAGPETVLDAFPAIAQQLDARAQQRILEVDPERARGILGDIIYRGDVHNPSAFVMKDGTAKCRCMAGYLHSDLAVLGAWVADMLRWMHHAFPRECPYPHEAGTTNPQTPDEWMKSNGRSTKVSQEQIEQIARDTCPAVLQEGAPIHCKTEDADLPWSSSEDRAPMLSLAGAQASDQDMAQENWEPPRMLWLAVLPSLVLFMFLFDRLLRRRSYASLIPAFVLIIVTLACTCVGIIDVRAAMGAGIAFFLWRFFVVPFTSFSIKDKLAESAV
ncbi:unnamed protein product [Effrenium voratum]|nr:unnamed protein product [Effrenium voratum]